MFLSVALLANLVVPAWAIPSRASASDLPAGDWNLNEKVSRSSAGADNVGTTANPRITKDGRFVVFESNSSTLVEGAGQDVQIYLHDRRTGSTELISRSATGESANSMATKPSVSDDGRYVVYQSKATNLVQETIDFDPIDSFERIYVYDTSTHSTHLVSVSATGAPADSFSQQAVISGDGQWVAFASEASNLSQDSKLYSWRLYLHNLQSGETQVIRNDFATGVDALEQPAISADGQVVAFRSSEAWIPEDTNQVEDIYLYDRSMHGVSLVSQSFVDEATNGASSSPSISADGALIAFTSEASNLVADDTNGLSDVFVFSRASGMTTRVSVTDTGAQADGNSLRPSLAPNGERVAFESHAFNLLSEGLPVDVNRMPDPSVVYVYNLGSQHVQLGSRPYQGQLNGESLMPALSDSGALAFRSDSENVAPATTPFQQYDYGSLYVAQNASTLPQWPADSKLTASDVNDFGLMLHWPALIGQDVVGYKVFRTNTHQELLGFVDASTSSFHVSERSYEDLQSGFQVEAVNSHNQTSWGSGPKLIKGWNDSEPPMWPTAPSLTITNYAGYISLYVSPEATDNVEVAGYRLYQIDPVTHNSTLLRESRWNRFEFMPNDLLSDTDYMVVIKAFDFAGNESTPSPEWLIHTPKSVEVQSGQLTVNYTAGDYDLLWTAGDASVTSYEVWDVTPGTVAQMLKQVPATETSWHLTTSSGGLHTLVIRGRDGQQRVVYQTNQFVVSTEGQNLSITVERTGMVGDSMPRGAQQAVTVTGAPNSPVTVTVSSDKWDTSQSPYVSTQVTTAVEMTESATPGVYKGTLTVPEGTSAITNIVASQANPEGGDPLVTAVAGLPWQVFAEWEATITVPAELARPLHYRVALVSPSRQINQVKSLNDSSTLSFGRLPGADDYTWKILDALGRTVQESPKPFSIYGGLKNPEQLDVKVTTVQVKLVEDSNTPVANAAVSLVNPSNGAILATLYTDASGMTRSFFVSNSQLQSVQVRVYLDENVYKRVPYQMLNLTTGQLNLQTLTVEKIGKGMIQGTVRNLDGSPLPDATVSVTQNVQGRFFNKSVMTNAEGKYSVEAVEGPVSVFVTLSAKYDYAHASRDVTVTANGTVTADFSIAAMQSATVKINLFTKYAGDAQWQGPLPIDWTVGIHMHMTVDGNYVNSDTLTVRGKQPGDVITVCADGREGGLQQACVDAVVDANMQAVADLRLTQDKTNIVGQLRLPAGAGTVKYWSASLYGADGAILENTSDYNKSSLRFATQKSGAMKLVIEAYGDNWSTRYRKSVDVNVTAGTPLDLGTLDLARLGVFSGNDGNSLTSSTPQVRPGQTGTIRAAFKGNRGVNNAKLILRIPQGTDYVADSVMLGDVAVPANQVDLISKPGFVIVKLGNLAYNQAGVVRFSFKVPTTFTEGVLLADAQMSYDGSGGDEIIGQVKLTSSQLTITAPLRTNHLAWTVNGNGPANQELSVFEGQQFLGKTTISAAGVWSLNLSLPDPSGDKLFHLQAVTTDGNGKTLRSKVVDVSYEPNDPVLQEMTMRQGDGRRVTLDLTHGVPRFPYVVRPWDGFYFDLKFNDPNAVENVKVHLGHGAGETVGLATKLDNGLWHVEMITSGINGVGEGIYVTYDRKKLPPTPVTKVPTEAEVRDRMPAGMRDVTIDSKENLHTVGNLTTGHIDLTLPDSNMGLGVDVAMEEGLTYSPTTEDLQKAASTGVPVYGMTFDVHQDESTGKWVSDISGYVQKPQTGLSVTQGLNLLLSGMGTPSPTSISPQYAVAGSNVLNVVKVTGKIVWNEKDALYKGGNDIQQTKQNIDGRYEVNKKFDQVVALAQRANACPGGAAWNESIEFANNMIIAGEASKWALNLAGAALAPETLGSSLVFNIAGNLLGAGVDVLVDARLKSLDDHISQMGDCAKPREDELGEATPTASPVWIYDPSGYVYETFEDNRVADAQATVYYLDAQTNEWVKWDADWYGQINPQITDPEGKYGWDVPNGKWKVVYEKAGYETTESGAMDVPPPRFNVNIPMVSTQSPTIAVTSAQSSNSATVLEFTTDKYVRTADLTANSLTVMVDNAAVTGTLTAVDAREDANNVSLARTFRFTTAQNIAAGKQVTIAWPASDVVSYAGIPAEPDAGQVTVTQTITVQTADTVAPLLSTATTSVSGDVITLTFNELLNTKKALSSAQFTLQGTTVTPASVEYGEDGQTVKLFLNGKTAQSGVVVNIAANSVEDRYANSASALSGNVTDNSVSSDASLQSLVLAGNAYPLTPAFSPNTTSYTLAVPDKMATTTLRAVTNDGNATMRLEGFDLASNQDRDITLAGVGDTVILLSVTAADQSTTRQYQITITHGYVPPVNNGGGGGGSVTPSPTGTLTLEDVKKSLSGSTLTIDLSNRQAPAMLQADAWAYLKEQGAVLVLKQATSTLTLPATAFDDQIEKQLGSLDKQVTLNLAWAEVTVDTASNWFRQASDQDAAYKPASAALQLVATATAGSRTVTLQPTGELHVTLALPQATDITKVGVYQYDTATRKWSYVRSTNAQKNGLVNTTVTNGQPLALLRYEKSFSDITEHWARGSIEHLAAHHIIAGQTDTAFNPEGNITRAEFVALIDRLIGLPDPQYRMHFTDVATSSWYVASVNRAAAAGIAHGFEDGTFQPEGQITREQMVVMAIGALRTNRTLDPLTEAEQAHYLTQFDDSSAIADWARESFAQAIKLGLVSGISADQLAPGDLLTRAQAAVILDRYPQPTL